LEVVIVLTTRALGAITAELAGTRSVSRRAE
jgi:hypothetical protein